MGTQSRVNGGTVAQSTNAPSMTGVILIVITAALLSSACTRERVAEEVESPVSDQPQEPVVAQITPLPTATFTPDPTPEDTPEPKVITYEVQPGDTVNAISEKFGTDPQRIRALNLLTTDALQVGQVLRVPNIPGVTTPQGIPTATPEPFEYTVQEGDTLLSIALHFGVTLNQIVSVNGLRDEHSLGVGQVLLVPGASNTEQPSAGGGSVDPGLSRQAGTHEVQAGETLAQIAEQYNVTLTDLIAFNGNTITNPHVVKIGTVLIIPGRSAADVSILNQTTYTVQEGDSLLGIAQQFGVTVEALMAANNISNADLLRVGDELIIPGP